MPALSLTPPGCPSFQLSPASNCPELASHPTGYSQSSFIPTPASQGHFRHPHFRPTCVQIRGSQDPPSGSITRQNSRNSLDTVLTMTASLQSIESGAEQRKRGQGAVWGCGWDGGSAPRRSVHGILHGWSAPPPRAGGGGLCSCLYLLGGSVGGSKVAFHCAHRLHSINPNEELVTSSEYIPLKSF